MKQISIPYCAALKFSAVPTLLVDCWLWENTSYAPETQVFLVHNAETLKVKIISYEIDIRCEVTEDDRCVCCDSCVEFFVCPYEEDERYINIEVNPNGAMVMGLGKDRHNRISLVKQYKEQLSVRTQITKEYWYAEYSIPLSLLVQIFEKEGPPTVMYGNFYKCGDQTNHPHYGMWNRIDSVSPDFHQPQFFGKLLIDLHI